MGLRYKNLTKIGVRIGAFLIDHFIVVIIFGSAQLMVIFKGNVEIILEMIIILTFFKKISYLIRDVFMGRSIGKRVLKTAVRMADNPNEVPEWWRLVVRNLTLCIFPIELFVMIFNPMGQRLGDILTKTIVVKLDIVSDENKSYIDEYMIKRKNHLNAPKVVVFKRVAKVVIATILTIIVFLASIELIVKNNPEYLEGIKAIEIGRDVENSL